MRTIDATIHSALAQSHRNIEVIIVDDGSTDDSARLSDLHAVRDPRVRVIRCQNSGVANARNTAIAAASGRWIAPLDADDIWHPEKIERQLRVATTARLRPSFVYAWSRRIDVDGYALMDLGRPQFRGDVLGPLVASNFLRNSSVPLICRDALDAVGGYDSGLQDAGAHGAEDLSMYLKLAEHGPVDLAAAFLVGYRHHPGSMSTDAGRMRRSVDLVLAQAYARRPDIAPALVNLAKMNYEFYSATLARSASDRGGFLRHIARAVAARPVIATGLLGAHVVEQVMSLASGTRRIKFDDLGADEPLASASLTLLDTLQAKAARRAAAGLRTTFAPRKTA